MTRLVSPRVIEYRSAPIAASPQSFRTSVEHGDRSVFGQSGTLPSCAQISPPTTGHRPRSCSSPVSPSRMTTPRSTSRSGGAVEAAQPARVVSTGMSDAHLAMVAMVQRAPAAVKRLEPRRDPRRPWHERRRAQALSRLPFSLLETSIVPEMCHGGERVVGLRLRGCGPGPGGRPPRPG